jgi:hypothetical protein
VEKKDEEPVVEEVGEEPKEGEKKVAFDVAESVAEPAVPVPDALRKARAEKLLAALGEALA